MVSNAAERAHWCARLQTLGYAVAEAVDAASALSIAALERPALVIIGHIGPVEALAEGPANSVEAFKHDLATGPQWAVVDQLEEINLDPTGTYSAFRIER